MIAAERLGAHQAKILKYANSGDVTGDKSRVVGYGAVVLLKVKSGRDAKQRAFSLSPKEKDGLLKIARKSVETAVRARTLYYPTLEGLESLQQDRGAFVTLKEHGELRGCIGYIAPMKPLYMTVRDVAGHAALRDSRFSPVTVDELGKLEYEVSVLSPLHRVADIKQIRLGQDGLVLWKGEYEGVFLPQVPTEQRWNLMTYLEQLCYKAGLPKDAWRDEDADLFSFTAIVFGDQPRPEAVTPEMPQPPARRGIPGELAPGSPTPQPPQF
jgi:AmmeMemoRadiSam system protein A